VTDKNWSRDPTPVLVSSKTQRSETKIELGSNNLLTLSSLSRKPPAILVVVAKKKKNRLRLLPVIRVLEVKQRSLLTIIESNKADP
jgi:hypothetical protein